MADDTNRQTGFAKAVSLGSNSSYRRERAAQLRAQAATETNERLRKDLLRLAEQYEGLAAALG